MLFSNLRVIQQEMPMILSSLKTLRNVVQCHQIIWSKLEKSTQKVALDQKDIITHGKKMRLAKIF